ncbi:MAG: hypothetical protein FD155_346 [Bacteroidetes bacterium]|nr:MAG: hypothetical protein FD155_346 [Bacteroidota bacterium]
MKIYLDNNILVSIEKNEIDFVPIMKDGRNFSFVYSYAHVQELLEAKNNFSELKAVRLKTIKEIMNNVMIYPDGNEQVSHPENIIQMLKMTSKIQENLRNVVNNFNPDRTKLIQKFGIDETRINNYDPEELIKYINTALRSNLVIEFRDLVDLAGNSLRERISTLFNLLDFVGFWKDKKTERSNLARVYDSSHAFFASYCDIFISNDKRARNKTKVAYSLYNIRTEVLSYSEFLGYKN